MHSLLCPIQTFSLGFCHLIQSFSKGFILLEFLDLDLNCLTSKFYHFHIFFNTPLKAVYVSLENDFTIFVLVVYLNQPLRRIY